MANQEHLKRLKQGTNVWNSWRGKHPEARANLRGADLRRASLRGADLSKANLEEADLSKANLRRANLSKANLSKANLEEAYLGGANLEEAYLAGADFHEANLIGANLRGANLSEANLHEANLYEAYLFRANLSGANLRGVYLHEANLMGANLMGANLMGADLGEADLIGADLHEANLEEADLEEADLMGANLSGANLEAADLHEANLEEADLMGANLSGANLRGAYLHEANLSGANLSGANLSTTILIGTNLTRATLKDCSIYGISAWDVQLYGAEQLNLRITPDNQPAITIDNLKVAQFVYLLLNNQELRDVLNSVMERGVLLLGRFGGGGLKELKAIAVELRGHNYLPMIFDFERPESRDFTETVLTLTGLSRFVIADLSGPSVPNELRATIPHIKIPFAPIIEEGRKVYSMFSDLLGYPWVLSPIEFTSEEHLIEILFSKVIQPAEAKFKERQALLHRIFDRNP